jgi:predicted secreted protein
MSEEEKGFVVKDRRIFTEEDKETEAGDEKAQTQPSTDENAQSAPATEKTREPEAPEPSKTDASEEQPQFPEINFPTFIVSLNASALLHLGAIEDPTTGQKTKNLPMAKQTIDILSMLEEKTAGNLNNEEKNLLKNILYDLRLMYVKEKG